MDWQPKKKRTGLIVTLVLVVVLAIGGGVGVWLWQGSGGGAADDPSADLPANKDLSEMAFPDPNSFGFGDGIEKMCASLDEKMKPRGYYQVSGDRSGETGLYCRFITPGLSLLKNGSNEIRVDIGVWKDNAVDRYAGLQEEALSQSETQKKDPKFSVSKVERFPVGDAGYIFHRESTRTDTEAYFRSGEYLMMVSVWGTVLVSEAEDTSDSTEVKPLPAEVTYREITDIVTTLNGEGEPGPPQIAKPELAKNPALAGTAELNFPEKLDAVSACPKIASATASLGLRPGGGSGCSLVRESDDWRDHSVGYTELKWSIHSKDYPTTGNIVASEELARDVRSQLKIAGGSDRECSPLYSLPFAETGYAVYCGNGLNVGFVLNGVTYVQIEFSGHRVVEGADLEPLPENEVMAQLVTVITAMAQG